ncbi:MAG TPA: TolC family protein, partial [Albitalea sp.]|nr:TolC family protein [Albitalea sp.]
SATTQLARWVGAPANEALGPPPPMQAVRFHAGDLEASLAQHPELLLMRKREEVAQADVELARANRQSDPSVELMFSQRGPAYSNMVSINVAVPLQWDRKQRQDREVAAKLALLEQAQAEREEATRMHIAETRSLWQEWQGLRERALRYDSTLIPLAGERTRAAIAAYRGASAPLSAVLEARRGEIDIRIERLRLEMDGARLWAQLNYLVPAGAASH